MTSLFMFRNPDSKSRPTFQDIQSFLEISDQSLLSWSPEDMEIVAATAFHIVMPVSLFLYCKL